MSLRKRGIFISSGGVRCVWLRHDLESFKKRLKAWRERMAEDYMNINLLEQGDSIIRNAAFDEDETRKCLERITGKPESIKTIEEVKQKYRALLLRSE